MVYEVACQMSILKTRTVYVGCSDENPNVFSRCKLPGCAMTLLDEEDRSAGVAPVPELPSFGTTTAGWPGAPRWDSCDSSLGGSCGVLSLSLKLSGCDLRRWALEELPMPYMTAAARLLTAWLQAFGITWLFYALNFTKTCYSTA